MQAKLLRVLESGEMRRVRVTTNSIHPSDVASSARPTRNPRTWWKREAFPKTELVPHSTRLKSTCAPPRNGFRYPELAHHHLPRFRPMPNLTTPSCRRKAIELLQSHVCRHVGELAKRDRAYAMMRSRYHPSPITPDHCRGTRFPRSSPQILGPVTLRYLEMQAIGEALDRHRRQQDRGGRENSESA